MGSISACDDPRDVTDYGPVMRTGGRFSNGRVMHTADRHKCEIGRRLGGTVPGLHPKHGATQSVGLVMSAED